MRSFFVSVILLLTLATTINAQSDSKLSYYGDLRLAHIGFDTDASGLNGDPITAFRLRPGLKYAINSNHSFSGRLVYLESTDSPDLEVNLRANGGRGLAFGTFTLDELYYQFKDSKQTLKVGRFQESFKVLSNAGRSIDRFQSNAIFVHWTDGISYSRKLNETWTAQGVLEYQNRDHISYPYSGNLNFGDRQDNLNLYAGINNRERDRFNFIQKDFGFFFAPNGYMGVNGYENYASLSARAAMDFPKKDLLRGGSLRLAGEIGQNVTTAFEDGTIAVISAGIHNFDSMHEFMIEFSTTDQEWLHASTYAQATEEMELRYRIFITSNLQMDTRYRVRVPRNSAFPYEYSTFIRATYSF